jgi:acetyltransferase-like isoleucine patch superfamily enzyme
MKLASLKSACSRLRRVIARNTLSGSEYAKFLGVKVGTGCRILTSRFGSEPFLISIGNDVTISNNVQFITHDGATWLIRDQSGRRYSFAPIKVGNFVFVGAGTTLMPGVEIGDNVIVGAGSVVTKSIPSGVVVAGNPAQILGPFSDYEQRQLRESASHRDMEAITGRLEKVHFGMSLRARKVMVNPSPTQPRGASGVKD